MSEPVIPVRKREEAVTDIIESIALEEAAIAHLINAEAEKVQESLKDFNPDDSIRIQHAVKEILNKVIIKQILLEFKLEEITEEQ